MKQKSFTLIEILVVIVIIGVLSAFILVGMSLITSSANIAKSKAFINSVDNSLLLARVSQWKLDQIGSGPFTTTDSWGINTGTLMDVDGNCSTTKCPQLVTSGCPSSNCLSFDGTDDYIDCGNNTSLDFGNATIDNPLTFSMWIKATDMTENTLLYKTGQYQFFTGGGDNLYLRLFDNSSSAYIARVCPVVTSYENQWIQIVATYNGLSSSSGIKIYLNGIRIDSGDYNSGTYTAMESLGNNLKMGGAGAGTYTGGQIDDVRIYNQAISTSKIQQNYFVGINKLFKNSGIVLNEFNQRLAELKSNLVTNE